MGPETVNRLKDSEIHGDFVGRDKITNIIMFQESEREFVVTHNACIKPVSYFTGRETELQELRERIEAGRKSVLVSGMGGIGKTHICRKLFEEYLNRHAEDKNGPFRHIGYIEYNGDMSSSLQNCLKFKQQESPEQNREAAWRELEYLASDGKLLLFVDNVDKTISADPGLQRLKGIPGAVVLTSRQVSISDEFEPYRIGFLGMEQCKEIYGKIRFEGSDRKVDPEEVEDLEYVIGSLAGRHTITVELLAHLARTKHWSVKRLREELEQKGFRLAFYKDGELVNIQESYEKLYDLSELMEAEQNILEAFSVFPYIPLAAGTCNEWLLADAGVSEDDDILMGLYQKGWLQFDMEQEGYALHPVFAQFIYEKCRPVQEKHCGLIERCQKNLEIPENGLVIGCQKFIPFAETIIEKIYMSSNIEQNELIRNLASLFFYIGEYKKAKELFKKELAMVQEVFGENCLDIAIIYDVLGCIYSSLNEYEKAMESHIKSLDICKKFMGDGMPDTYYHLAYVYEARGKYKEAEKLYENVLQMIEKISGEENLFKADVYNNLGLLYEKQGRYKEAEEQYIKVLQIDEKELGKEHLKTSATYNNLALLRESQGKYEEAEEYYIKALQIYEKELGKEHPNTATVYNNLAVVYQKQGEYGKAEELFKKVMSIREKIFGEENISTANAYNNLARVYMRQGEYNEAEELHEKALRIREWILDQEHPDIATSYNDLALLYERQGKYKEAEYSCKKALQIRKKVFGEEHPCTADVYSNLAMVYEDQGEYKKAENLYKKSIWIREKILGDENPDTAMAYYNIACMYDSKGEYKIAISYYLKAYNILLFKMGINHPITQNVYRNFKLIYYERNPKGDFEQWLREQMREVRKRQFRLIKNE